MADIKAERNATRHGSEESDSLLDNDLDNILLEAKSKARERMKKARDKVAEAKRQRTSQYAFVCFIDDLHAELLTKPCAAPSSDISPSKKRRRAPNNSTESEDWQRMGIENMMPKSKPKQRSANSGGPSKVQTGKGGLQTSPVKSKPKPRRGSLTGAPGEEKLKTPEKLRGSLFIKTEGAGSEPRIKTEETSGYPDGEGNEHVTYPERINRTGNTMKCPTAFLNEDEDDDDDDEDLILLLKKSPKKQKPNTTSEE